MPEKCIGIQITASHNPIEDNGIKQVDFDGTMIRNEWEKLVNPYMIEPDLQKAVDDVLAAVNKDGKMDFS